MEAGLLAIAAGKPIALSADMAVNKESQQGKSEGAAFGLIMKDLHAAGKQVLLTEERASAPTALKLIALAAIETAAQGVQPKVNLDVTGSNPQLALLTLPAQSLAQGQILPTTQGLEMQSDNASATFVLLPPQALQQLAGDALPEAPDALYEAGALVLSAGEDHLLALRDDLSVEELEAIAQWVQQIQQLISQPDAQDIASVGAESGLSAALFVPLQGGFSDMARDMKAGHISLTDSPDSKGAALAGSLADAIAADDLSQLSDADLAKLDALVDKIAQRGLSKQGDALGQFGAMLDEQLSELRSLTGTMQSASVSPQDSAQLSSLSASHATQQTRPHDENLSMRFMQMTHSSSAASGNASEQVKVTISQAFSTGLDRVVIQLDPADLGRVDVRLDMGADGRVQMVVQADNRDTLDMLQRDARMLERALQEAGINASMQDMAFNLGQGKNESDGDDQGAVPSGEALALGAVEESSSEVLLDAIASGYTLSIAQGLNIKV